MLRHKGQKANQYAKIYLAPCRKQPLLKKAVVQSAGNLREVVCAYRQHSPHAGHFFVRLHVLDLRSRQQQSPTVFKFLSMYLPLRDERLGNWPMIAPGWLICIVSFKTRRAQKWRRAIYVLILSNKTSDETMAEVMKLLTYAIFCPKYRK